MKKTAFLLMLTLGTLAVPGTGWADPPKRVGGHIGAVVPLVSRADGQTTTVADDFVIGFPGGFKVAERGRFVVDFEVVPVLQNEPRDLSWELHPGVVMKVSDGLAAGLRAAVDVEGNAWGFTPLVNRTLYVSSTHTLFAEAVVPIRFVDAGSSRRTSVGFGVHVGIGF